MTRTRRWLRRGLLALVLGALLAGGALWWAHRHLARLIVASFNRTYPGLELTAKAAVLSGLGELELKSVRVRVRSDGSDVMKVPSAKLRFSWGGLRAHFIREVVIEQPGVKVSDALLAALPAGGTGGGSADAVPWRIGHLAVKGGTGRFDVAALPSLRLGFEVELNEREGANVFTVHALSGRTRPDGVEVLALPAVQVRASLADLRQQRIRDVTMESPRVVMTDALLAALPPTKPDDPARPAWTVDRVTVRDGRARVDLAARPRVEFGFDAKMEKAEDGGTPLALVLSEVRVRTRGDDAEALSIPSVKVAASLEGLRAQRVAEVVIAEPRVTVTDALLAAFSPGAEVVPAAPPAEPTAAWTLERLALTGGRASLDVRGAPLVQWRFAAQLGEDLLPPREPRELQAAVDFTDIAVRARGAAVEPFLRVPAVRTKFRLPEVQREHRLAWMQVEGFDFRFNKIFRDLIASGEKPAPPAAPNTAPARPARPFSIGELLVTDGGIHLDDLGLGLPSIECRVNTVFRHLALAPDAGVGGQELQTIELSRLALTSPLDPFVSVLALDTVFIRFTLAGIWRREIEEVAIIRPRLDIGPDLFWYVDRVQKNASAEPEVAAPAPEAGPGWQVRRFSATSGQLFLALEGHSEVALPMPFESHAENLNFQKLSDLRLKLSIEMPEQNYHYPGYELALTGVAGRLEFSLPPEQGQNNVVNTLRLREVRWKQFRGRDCFLSVTYDERGIYGNLGGKGYGGNLSGQFNFLLGGGSPWNGWISGTRINLQPITDALAPEKFSLSGPADFRVTASARGTEFEQVVGDFSAKRGGQLRIGKIDDLLKELPGDWSGVKRGLSRISLEALRDFTYDSAHGDFRFHGREGALHLDLRGPGGSRRVELDFHDAPPRRGARVAAQRP
ncbi:MAG: hypothetical protein K8R23_17105 [Chthoniobacter sp.]|nr:hypothetical protein [Chthoniobacter sp.]